MSILRRKRLQNRMELKTIPATRESRYSLESVPVRGLRNIFGRKLAEQRKRNRTIIEQPYEIRPDISLNRDIRQLKFIHEQNKIRLRVSREHRKPLSVIQLNGKIRVDLPPEHPICIRRKERRAMMFVSGKAGRSGQRPRQQEQIKLRCK